MYNISRGGGFMKNPFSDYTHSLPIIHSHLEGQYKYTLSSPNKSFLILYTSFDYHFITGDIPNDEKEIIEELRNYIKENNPEELVLFSPNEEWENYLTKIFTYIGGVIDFRCSFTLDKTEFKRIYDNYQFNHQIDLVRFTDKLSSSPYYQAEVYDNEKLISFSRAFMEGKANAELDVWTDKDYRYKGLAFEASLVVINKLLDLDFTPNWTCWEEKKASQMLAYKLGYINPIKIKAFIWTNDFGRF